MTRELDAAVAEKVMKLSYILFDGTDKDAEELIPAYSTDISPAWQVVEKMEKHKYYFAIYNLIDAEIWACRFGNQQGEFEGRADTAPEAICLAALKAVDSEQE